MTKEKNTPETEKDAEAEEIQEKIKEEIEEIREEEAKEQEAPAEENPAEEEAKPAEDEPKAKRSEVKKLRKELEETKKALEAEKQRAAELDDRVLRLAAEYDNFRKRSQAERANVYANAVSDTLAGILPIIDNLQYAAKYSGGDSEKVAEGVDMILSKLPETLDKLGIKAFGEAGEKFDPNLHNAVMHIEDESFGEGEIVEVLQQGYQYGDRVLRYAMVKTAN